MKILVFSDSHGRCEKMINIVSEFKAKNAMLNYIVHLGDLVRDAKYLQEKFPDIPVLYVYGNGDFSFDRKDQEKEFEIGGKKFFILHGHTRNVYSFDSLKFIAEQKDYDIFLFQAGNSSPWRVRFRFAPGETRTVTVNVPESILLSDSPGYNLNGNLYANSGGTFIRSNLNGTLVFEPVGNGTFDMTFWNFRINS